MLKSHGSGDALPLPSRGPLPSTPGRALPAGDSTTRAASWAPAGSLGSEGLWQRTQLLLFLPCLMTRPRCLDQAPGPPTRPRVRDSWGSSRLPWDLVMFSTLLTVGLWDIGCLLSRAHRVHAHAVLRMLAPPSRNPSHSLSLSGHLAAPRLGLLHGLFVLAATWATASHRL